MGGKGDKNKHHMYTNLQSVKLRLTLSYRKKLGEAEHILGLVAPPAPPVPTPMFTDHRYCLCNVYSEFMLAR